MSSETLDNNQMHYRVSPTPLDEAICIFDWFELVITLEKD